MNNIKHMLNSQTSHIISQMSSSIEHQSIINRQQMKRIMRVGGPHFKRMVQSIRLKHITTRAAIVDMIDNIFGITKSFKLTKIICDITLEYCMEGKLCGIKISDNIPSGFKDLFKEGTENPFNMTHMREGHSNDDETSEFGTGLKEAIILLSYLTEIYTHYRTDAGEEGYAKIGFDIDKMSSAESPEESFQPSEYNLDISRDEFMQNHVNSGNPPNGDNGSTVHLRLRKNQNHMYDPDSARELDRVQFEEYILQCLRNTFSGILKCDSNEVALRVNGTVITPNAEFLHLVDAKNKKSHTFYCELNERNECISVYRKRNTPGRTPYTEYVEVEKEFRYLTEEEFKSKVNVPNVYPAILDSFTTKGSECEHTQHQNKVGVSRDGRFYEEIPYTKSQTDGYSNHIGHNLTFTSKKLSPIIGVGSNKRVVPPPNMLTSAIRTTVESITTDFRKYARNYKKNIASSSSSISGYNSDSTESVLSQASGASKRKTRTKVTTTRVVGGGGGDGGGAAGSAPVVTNDVVQQSHESESVSVEPDTVAVNEEPSLTVDAGDSSLPESLPESLPSVDVNASEIPLPEIPQERLYNVASHSRSLCSRGEAELILHHLKSQPEYHIAMTDTIDDLFDDNYHNTIPSNAHQRRVRFTRITNCDGSFESKCDFIIEMLKERYPSPDELMNKGAELRRKYNAVTGSEE